MLDRKKLAALRRLLRSAEGTCVDEADFWTSLEWRVSRELEGMSDNRLRYLWCDGFKPQYYFLDDNVPCIVGRARIVNGQKQDDWEFTLYLTDPASSQAEIDWASLIPPDNVTGWLAVDQAGKQIQIETDRR
jgi:hypothetical protein